MGNIEPEFSLKAKCPHCQATIAARPRDRGRETSCPRCREEFEISDAREVSGIPEERPDARAPKKPRTSEKSDFGAVGWLVIVAAILGARHFADLKSRERAIPNPQSVGAPTDRPLVRPEPESVPIESEEWRDMVLEAAKRRGQPEPTRPRTMEQSLAGRPAQRLPPLGIPEVDLTPLKGTDPHLYLIHTLEDVLQFPELHTGFAEVPTAHLDARLTHVRGLHEEAKRLGRQEVTAAYAMAVELTEDFRNLYLRLERLGMDENLQAEADSAQAAARATAHGVSAFRLAHSQIQDDDILGTSLAVGAAAWGFSYLFQEGTRSRAREQRFAHTHETEIRQFELKVLDRWNLAERLARLTEKERSSPRGACGFVASYDDMAVVTDLIMSGDYAAAAAAYRPIAAAQPDNTRAKTIAVLIEVAAASPAQAESVSIGAARELVTLCRKVPALPAFDADRAELLDTAASLALEAAAEDANLSFAEGSPHGGFAAALYSKLTDSNPSDPVGSRRFNHALALAYARRYAEAKAALGAIAPLFDGDPTFHYMTACASSLAGDQSGAMANLKKALAAGIGDPRSAKADIDLSNLALAYPQQIESLLSLQVEWNINFGNWEHDDISLTNLSAFPLTNLTATANLVGRDKAHEPDLPPVDYLGPGDSHVWENVMWVKGSVVDEKRLHVVCDQGEAELD